MNLIKKENSDIERYEVPSWEPDVAEDLDIRRIWATLRKHQWKILVIVVLALAGTALLTFLSTPQYRATVVVQIDPEAAKVVPYPDIAESTSAGNYELYMKTKDQVLRSPTLTRRTLNNLRNSLEESEYQELEEEMKSFPSRLFIQRVEGSQIVNIAFSSSNPEFAATVANTFAQEFIKLHFEIKLETTEKAEEFLRKQLQVLKGKLEEAEKNLVEYASRHGMSNLDNAGQDVAQERFGFLTDRLSQVESEYFAKTAELESLQQADPDNFPERLKNGNINSLEDKLLTLEQELQAMRAKFAENWPDLVKKREELALAREQLRRAKEAAIKDQVLQVQMEYQAARNEYRLLGGAVREQEQTLKALNEASIQYNILQREVNTNETLYEGLLQRLKETGVVAGLEFGNIHIIDPARPPLLPYSPRPFWNLFLALLLSCTIGVSLAFVLEYFDTTIETTEEIEAIGLPSLGLIPAFAAGNGHRSRKYLSASKNQRARLPEKAVKEKQSSRLAEIPATVREAYRSVCASMLLSKGDSPARTLLVTSAVPFEGKSTTTVYLSMTMAANGSRTLIVDLDLRKPALSQMLGVEDGLGASLYLSGNAGSLPNVQKTAVPNLSIITAGPVAPNPISLLDSERAREMFRLLRANFRYILIDSPPVLTVADPWIIAQLVDGVIMVVRAGDTRTDLIRKATAKLVGTGAHVLGTVLNSADITRPGYSYYSSYQDPSYYTSNDDFPNMKPA